jgi:hypothetical protein
MAESYAFLNPRKNYVSERITVTAASVGGTTALVDGHAYDRRAAAAVITAITNGIYYTLDGSTPDATNGKRLLLNEDLPLAGYQKVKKFRAVRDGGVDAVIDIAYYN